MDMILWNLKYIGRLVIKLKVIKYKKDFFCYLSFYPDLNLSDCMLLGLFLGHMHLIFSIKYICPSLGS